MVERSAERDSRHERAEVNKRLLLLPAAVIVLGVAFLVGTSVYLDRWAGQPLSAAEDTVFIVRPTTTFSAVAESLAEMGIVNSSLLSLRARQRGLQSSVQSGEYRIRQGETADSLLDRLAKGDVVAHRFLIVEGSTVAMVLERLAADERVEFDLGSATADDLMESLGLPAGHAEGWFFPDTYLFKRGANASSLLARARGKMEGVLAEAWPRRAADLVLEKPYEALILASIVEKETGLPADRARVAGVFVRRLGRGMRLQSDPTVIYGLGSDFDGNLTKVMLNTDGPYNTYRRSGLPPTPIALPGRASIEAALHPKDEKALYFVSRGDGTSEFSQNLEDHNKAIRLYQRR